MRPFHVKCLFRLRTALYGLLLVGGLPLAAQEICDNGVDDDGDGRVDLNDPACACEVIEPVSLIPNPSFEETDCCPSDRSQLGCATGWVQASEPTTDFLNTCGWMGWDEFPPPQPFPDGQGIMGFRDGRVLRGGPEPYWKEYAGACLLSPLQPDTRYRFQFDVGFVNSQQSPAINISFFGTTSCDNLPFGTGNEAFGCPSNSPDWVKLGEVWLSGGGRQTWVNAAIDIVPDEPITAIAIGPDCPAVSSAESTYYFFDNLLLDDQESFDLQITETGHPCGTDFGLSVPLNPNANYQWYLDGVALPAERGASLNELHGEGAYQVRIDENGSCRLTLPHLFTIPEYRTTSRVAICADEFYRFGDARLTASGAYRDTFLNRDNCDSIVDLQLEVIGTTYDTVAATVLNGEPYVAGAYSFRGAGNYPLVFTSSWGCDSLVYLQLSVFDVFIPNAFSPNGDRVNDVFRPFSASQLIASVEMRIYDRWGNLVYAGEEWNGGELPTGVFVYTMLLGFTNGSEKSFDGHVTLLR